MSVITQSFFYFVDDWNRGDRKFDQGINIVFCDLAIFFFTFQLGRQ